MPTWATGNADGRCRMPTWDGRGETFFVPTVHPINPVRPSIPSVHPVRPVRPSHPSRSSVHPIHPLARLIRTMRCERSGSTMANRMRGMSHAEVTIDFLIILIKGFQSFFPTQVMIEGSLEQSEQKVQLPKPSTVRAEVFSFLFQWSLAANLWLSRRSCPSPYGKGGLPCPCLRGSGG
jgi:hypothetical protein